MKQLAPNTLVQNRYLVVHAIGKGGMGEVYLAVDQRLGSAVAIKRTRFESESELGKAFEREAKILARLRHPVLPKVIDHFMEGDGQFLVMEHISGDDLAKRLEISGKPFPVSWVMFWADQLLDALNYLHLHEPPIIHRDIKPQNLKLTDNNHIVLLDFGLSKDYESTNTGGSSGVGSIVGYSPGFAPMEQIRGTGTDARSDLYSLGATLYQLLTDVTPADALTRADDILGGKPDPLKSLNELNPEVPPAVSDIILRSMSIRQDERFGTATEMQKALRRSYNQSKSEPAPPEQAATPVITRTASEASVTPVTSASIAGDTTAERNSDVAEPAMDATLRMAPNSEMETVVRQSDVKTEVFKVADSKVTPAGPTNGSEQKGVSLEEPKPSRPAPPPAVKTQSRTGLYVGIAIAILVIGGLAAGGGWYAYSKSQVAGAPTPAATPDVPVTPAPVNTEQPQPTPDQVGLTNSENTTTSANTGNVSSPSAPKTATKDAPAKPKTPTKTKAADDRTIIKQ